MESLTERYWDRGRHMMRSPFGRGRDVFRAESGTKVLESQPICGWWDGPIWKEEGETCVCVREPHTDATHKCDCGAWFQGCGHPPGYQRPEWDHTL